jgi:hypothetical protein
MFRPVHALRMILPGPPGRTVSGPAPARAGSSLFVRRQAMTDTSPADRYAWRTSADIRDEESSSDAFVHGGREDSRFYADRA